MGIEIHAKLFDNGSRRYKIWSTGIDAYHGEELTEEELLKWMLRDYVNRAIEMLTIGALKNRSIGLRSRARLV